ncbi:MAG: G5 domain-containing protein, partial [Acidaminococcaceae bacterium]|nr:G5 domain-containing protein [Acidaminococcaceae bacterium]
MKRRMNKEMNRRVLQGLAGIFLSVSVFVLPVSGYAEEAAATGQVQHAVTQAQEAAENNNAAAPEKYVMPQEQVYLDQSQVEAAKQQLEADAFYNANPQNAASAVEEKPEEKKVEEAQPVSEAKQTVGEEKPAEEVKPEKYVMPQEQVYLDQSQVEAAKQQLEADAFYNANPQNGAPAVETKAEETKSVAEVKSEEQTTAEAKTSGQSPVVSKPAEKAVVAEEKKPEEKKVEATQPVSEAKQTVGEAKPVEAQKTVVVEKPQPEEGKAAEPAKQVEVQKIAVPSVKEENAVKESVAEIKPVAETKQSTVSAAEEKTVTEPANIEAAETVQENAIAKKPVRIRRFGTAQEVVTHQVTVADVLKDMKVNMEGRSSYPPPETKITDGMVIHVLGRKSFVSHEEVEVPYQTQVVDDPELAFGTKQVATAGVKGKDIVTYENITRVGHEQKIELDRRHVIAPVNEIVRQGVAQSVLTPDGYVRYKK